MPRLIFDFQFDAGKTQIWRVFHPKPWCFVLSHVFNGPIGPHSIELERFCYPNLHHEDYPRGRCCLANGWVLLLSHLLSEIYHVGLKFLCSLRAVTRTVGCVFVSLHVETSTNCTWKAFFLTSICFRLGSLFRSFIPKTTQITIYLSTKTKTTAPFKLTTTTKSISPSTYGSTRSRSSARSFLLQGTNEDVQKPK